MGLLTFDFFLKVQRCALIWNRVAFTEKKAQLIAERRDALKKKDMEKRNDKEEGGKAENWKPKASGDPCHVEMNTNVSGSPCASTIQHTYLHACLMCPADVDSNSRGKTHVATFPLVTAPPR